MITAPTNNNTAPVAASGARTGAMPSAARKDQAHGAQELKDSDDPEGTLAEVSDPFRGRTDPPLPAQRRRVPLQR